MYNSAGSIERCLNSVVSQPGAELEILCIDNGKNEGIEEVLKPYGDKITLLKCEEKGASKARNMGLKHASGDFVMFVDADDALLPGAVEKAVSYMKETSSDIVRMGYFPQKEGGEPSYAVHVSETKEVIDKDAFKEKIYSRFIGGIKLNSIWATLFKRSCIEGLEFDAEMKIANDVCFSILAYTRAERVCIVPDEAYSYHVSVGGGLTRNASLKQKFKYNFAVSKRMLNLLPEWGMDTPIYRARVRLRPFILTFDKVKRMRSEKKLRGN